MAVGPPGDLNFCKFIRPPPITWH